MAAPAERPGWRFVPPRAHGHVLRYQRTDGACVRSLDYDTRPRPWAAYAPPLGAAPLLSSRHAARWFGTPAAAMRAVDREFPIGSGRP